MNIGEPAANRTIIVALHAATNLEMAYKSLQIGAVVGQKIVSVGEDEAPSGPSAIFVAPVPLGKRADFKVEVSATAVRCAAGVYAAYGLNSTAADAWGTAVSTAPSSLSLKVQAGGLMIAALSRAANSTSTTTWGAIDERYDQVMTEAAGTPTLISGASRDGIPTTGNQIVTIDVQSTAAFNFRAVGASFH